MCQTDAAGGGGAARARRRGVLNLNRQRSIGRRALLRPLRLTPSCLMTRAPSAMRKQLQNTQAVHFGWVASGTYLWNPFESRTPHVLQKCFEELYLLILVAGRKRGGEYFSLAKKDPLYVGRLCIIHPSPFHASASRLLPPGRPTERTGRKRHHRRSRIYNKSGEGGGGMRSTDGI